MLETRRQTEALQALARAFRAATAAANTRAACVIGFTTQVAAARATEEAKTTREAADAVATHATAEEVRAIHVTEQAKSARAFAEAEAARAAAAEATAIHSLVRAKTARAEAEVEAARTTAVEAAVIHVLELARTAYTTAEAEAAHADAEAQAARATAAHAAAVLISRGAEAVHIHALIRQLDTFVIPAAACAAGATTGATNLQVATADSEANVALAAIDQAHCAAVVAEGAARYIAVPVAVAQERV